MTVTITRRGRDVLMRTIRSHKGYGTVTLPADIVEKLLLDSNKLADIKRCLADAEINLAAPEPLPVIKNILGMKS